MRVFHGRISREEAETRLMEAARAGGGSGEGLYLVRENPRNNYSLILSFTELKPTRRQWTKPAVEDEEQQHKEGGASKTELAVTHWQVNVNRYSKVEGFFLINKPNRVCLTLNDLLVDVASVQARTPALRPEGGRVESVWWEELMLWRTEDYNQDSLLYALPDDLLVNIFAFIDRPSLITLHLVCKHFYALARDGLLWRNLYRMHFGRRVPQVQLASSDIDWKLKYYFDHVLLTVESEPRVVGLNVPWKNQAQATFCSPSRSYHIEYSTEEPNVFHFITDPETLSSRVLHPLCSARCTIRENGGVAIYRVKSGYKAGYSLERDPASLGSIYPSLQKLTTFIRTRVCRVDPFPLAFTFHPNDDDDDGHDHFNT